MTRKDRPPWPMRWIVVAIIAILVPYTLVTLHYRKPNKPFSPYGDLKDRAQVARLLDAGFGRNRGTVTRAAALESPGSPPISPAAHPPVGVPPRLLAALLDPPLLPQRLGTLAAPNEIETRTPLTIVVEASIDSGTPPRAELYRNGQEVTLLLLPPEADGPAGATAPRLVPWRIEFGAGVLPVGSYRIDIPGQEAGATFTLSVRAGNAARNSEP